MLYNENVYYLLCSCTSLLLGKNRGQNALSYSDCGIFKSSISLEQIEKTASKFARWYKFTKIKNWLKIFWWGIFKNECSQVSRLSNWLYLKKKHETNWFFACWYNFWDEHGRKWVWPVWWWDFFHAATNSGKLKVDSIIFGVVVVKNGHGFLVHETLESVVLRMNLWMNLWIEQIFWMLIVMQ